MFKNFPFPKGFRGEGFFIGWDYFIARFSPDTKSFISRISRKKGSHRRDFPDEIEKLCGNAGAKFSLQNPFFSVKKTIFSPCETLSPSDETIVPDDETLSSAPETLFSGVERVSSGNETLSSTAGTTSPTVETTFLNDEETFSDGEKNFSEAGDVFSALKIKGLRRQGAETGGGENCCQVRKF